MNFKLSARYFLKIERRLSPKETNSHKQA